MIYGRFRAGETSAELTWIGSAPGPLRQGPATATGRRPAPLRDDHVRPRAAAMPPQGRSSRAGASLGQQESCGIPALPSFAPPRLRICYTARNRGRSAKPARSLLTELFPQYSSA